MEFLTELLPDNLLSALGWTLVHSLWQLIVIAGFLWIVLRVFKSSSSATKYGFAVAALVISFLTTLGTFSYEYAIAEEIPALSSFEIQALRDYSTVVSRESNWETLLYQGKTWIEKSLPLLVNVWFLGALLFLFRLLNSLSEIRTLRKFSVHINDFSLENSLKSLSVKMGISRSIQLKISKTAVSPLTFGTLKPIILLPAGLIFQLSPAQLEAILAHELAHVKRNDYLSNLLLSSLEVLFFFHPCYWWMNTTVQELRENAADDLTVKAGIAPKNLATSLAEVLNYAKQNPPELALAAGKRRNPTLQRIKRILGYPAQNYPQTPIISIPMLLTLFLSAGLMASAQQDTPKPIEPIAGKVKVLDAQPTFFEPTAQDTTVKTYIDPKTKKEVKVYGNDVMIITTDDGKTYQIKGDVVISDGDTVVLSGKTKAALDKMRALELKDMPEFSIPDAPEFPGELAMAPIPDFEFQFEMPEMPPMPPMDMAEFSFPEMNVPPFEFEFNQDFPGFYFRTDTTKMTKEEREKWQKEMEEKARVWSKEAESRAKEWESKWKETEGERKEKMAQWEARFKQEFEPRMKEFEARMKEWQAANEPKMKEFEEKMKVWQEAQEPKMKEWEARMKEWEKAQQPKMEEFQRKMEVWQKEYQSKMDEFQKLLQEELKKNKN
ncbi:beta-lactamase regulating signal transducer with metallopeptidase domain [Algoriphagus boseongensis]|uniref:Beta-lactamase regulating signal transducer with metallopeptidase domain n=1 Tax=Algoriphagus boseongensis TaxID=1442587 RepID=A0A4R6T2H9_9BACT|nr:M56 family metallopeptidase [Algoriphagus boseongensis]TDQ14634.1 beta-lactamase regulating signal transducer with metallopeptidase domain [Algoriphagus boseongensis]